MQIDSSSIALASEHYRLEEYSRSESLRMWVGEAPGEGANPLPAPEALLADSLEISPEALELESEAPEVEPREMLRARILQEMFKALTGRELEGVDPAHLTVKEEGEAGEAVEEAIGEVEESAGQGPGSFGFGLEYDLHEFRREKEEFHFQAEGVIRTRDGREISFSSSLSMSREFVEEHHLSIRMGDAVLKDPLVVDFGGMAEGMTERRFHFDLDVDGTRDRIAFVPPGAGFLALDRNGDGKVNDGSELFGPRTGDGFAELARYDKDDNGFIDEGDAIFDRLQVWSRDGQGREQLRSLREAGIGAIYLENVATPFSLQAGGEEVGKVARSGIFLKEGGDVGNFHQIDLLF